MSLAWQRPIPSLVTLIDRHPEPEYAQFAEMQRPAEKDSRVFPWIVLAALGCLGVAFYLSVLMEVSK